MRNYERRLEKEKAIKRAGENAWNTYQSNLKQRESIVKKFPIFKSENEAIQTAVKKMANEMKAGIKDGYSGETVKGIASTTIYVVPKELGGGFLVAPDYIALEAIEWLGMDYYDNKKMDALEKKARNASESIDHIDEV